MAPDLAVGARADLDQTLDNRRANLRWATNKQNSGNRTLRARIPTCDAIVRQLMADALAAGEMRQLEEIPFF